MIEHAGKVVNKIKPTKTWTNKSNIYLQSHDIKLVSFKTIHSYVKTSDKSCVMIPLHNKHTDITNITIMYYSVLNNIGRDKKNE